MPFELQIIRATEFVRIGPQGRPDFKATKETLAMLAEACRKRGLDRALLDLRSLAVPPKPLFTPSELEALIETFHEAGFRRRQRLAVLYRSDPHLGVRMFAFIGRMKGWHVRAFGDFESALMWLSASEPEKRPRPEGEALPIQFTQSPKAIAGTSGRTGKARASTRVR